MIEHCKFIELPRFLDERGNLAFIEGNKDIPFEIKRIYYLYNVPNVTARGGHAHKKLKQLIIPLAGSFTIELNDGKKGKTFHLNQPLQGLYITPMIWRELYNFSPGSVCLVLASDYYSEDDYYRSYEDFEQDTMRASD